MLEAALAAEVETMLLRKPDFGVRIPERSASRD